MTGNNHNEDIKEGIISEPLVPPQMIKVGNSFHLTYPQLGLRLRFCRLYDQKNGLTAEVIVEGNDKEDNPIIYDSSRYTLTALASRNNLAKHLLNRLEMVETDWEGFVLQAFTMVVNAYRIGEPIISIQPTQFLQPLEYLVYPILPKNMPTTLVGEGGAGKSKLAVLLCTLLTSAYKDSEDTLGLKIPKEPQVCLYLDWESDQEEISDTFSKFKNGLGIDEDIHLHYRRCWQPLADDMDEIQKVVAEIKPSLVVIDSIAAAVQSDMVDAGVATKLISRDLRQLKCTALILAHFSKQDKDKSTPFGSVFYFNYSRAVWSLQKSKESEKDRMQIGLYCKKFNRSFLHKPLSFEFTYFPDGIVVHRKSLADSPSLASTLPMQDRIKNMLSRKPQTSLELANQFKLSEPTIKKILSDHSDMFMMLGDNKWGVKSNMPSEVYR